MRGSNSILSRVVSGTGSEPALNVSARVVGKMLGYCPAESQNVID